MSTQILEGKVGLVFGVANKRSIAWAIAQAWAAAGAKLIFSYQGERIKANVEELTSDLGEGTPFYPCDVTRDEDIAEFFKNVRTHTSRVDLMLHSVAFAPKEALEGDFLSTTREAFRVAHDVSAYSLLGLAREAALLMTEGGSIVAMTYYGSEKVIPHYNVMGVAKASLEATTRYLAYDLGPKKIRVNCISAGPVNTLAARGISGFTQMLKHYEARAPLGRSCHTEELGQTGVFLASDGAGAITGQVIYVDGGYQIMDVIAAPVAEPSVTEPEGALAAAIRQLLGSEAEVSDDAAVLAAHSGDKWFASHLPEAVVFARSAPEVARLLRFCSAHAIPVTARGAGYGYVGGCVPMRGGVALSLARMNRILELDGRDFVAVVEPGVITGDLQSAARERGLFYPPDPSSLKNSTLGGNIATNAGGPRCLKYGVTRHYVLGLEVVLPNGDIVRCGGRTHKNKTGFDLVGLFVGSEGLLGVVTQATLRLLPLPPARAAISCGFTDIRAAAGAVQAVFARGWLPAALEIADRFTLESARGYLGAGHVPAGDAHLLIELDGRESSLRLEIADLEALLVETGAISPRTAFDEECERLWDLRRAFSESLKATGLTKLNEDVVVPRSRLVDLIDFAAGLQSRYGIPVACFGHAGDGNIHVNLMAADYDRAEVAASVERALDELFGQIIAWGGAITGEHGVGLAKRRWWPRALSEENRALHRTLKQALDPSHILNPDKFLEDLPRMADRDKMP